MVGDLGCESKQILIRSSELCGLNFFPISNGLVDPFGFVTVLEDDDRVLRQQAEEDQQIFGGRPAPSDFDENRGALNISNGASGKRSAEQASLEESQIQKSARFESGSASSQEEVPQILTWLDQNVEALEPVAVKKLTSPADPIKEMMETEVAEIEQFKNVHMSEDTQAIMERDLLKEVSDLSVEARIYYRNILDRYPLLKPFLARRLAEANACRSVRLRCQRENNAQQAKERSDTLDQDRTGLQAECQDHAKDRNDSTPCICGTCSHSFKNINDLNRHQLNLSHEKDTSCNHDQCEECFDGQHLPQKHRHQMHAKHREVPPSRHHTDQTHPPHTPPPLPPPHYVEGSELWAWDKRWPSTTPRSPARPRPSSDVGALDSLDFTRSSKSASQPPVDFWGTGSQSHRPMSIDSRSSSMNSSLRGVMKPDPGEQNFYPEVTGEKLKLSRFQSAPGLLPLPTPLGNNVDCDICGENIKIKRRLEWQ